MDDNQYFSPDGLKKLKDELEHRLKVLRPEVTTRIKEAKEQGDLSENAEYDSAKEAQALNEGRIEELKSVLEKAVIIEYAKKGGAVVVGSSIMVEGHGGKSHQFTIVGASESDPVKGFISNESPLGSAFLGHKKGDTIEVETPKGVATYTIVKVG